MPKINTSCEQEISKHVQQSIILCISVVHIPEVPKTHKKQAFTECTGKQFSTRGEV